MLSRIYFIRHGETEWSLYGRHRGHTDVPLTAHGENAARELGQRLRDIPFAHVLTSPRQRARLTCELAGLPPVAEIEPDRAEWDYGDYEGLNEAMLTGESTPAAKKTGQKSSAGPSREKVR